MSNDAFKKEQGVKKNKNYAFKKEKNAKKDSNIYFIFIYYTHFILVDVTYLK
jgi:hypothetical protein